MVQLSIDGGLVELLNTETSAAPENLDTDYPIEFVEIEGQTNIYDFL